MVIKIIKVADKVGNALNECYSLGSDEMLLEDDRFAYDVFIEYKLDRNHCGQAPWR